MELNINITLTASPQLLEAIRSLSGKAETETIIGTITAEELRSQNATSVADLTEEKKDAEPRKAQPKPKKAARTPDEPAPGYRRMAGWMTIMGRNPAAITQMAAHLNHTFKVKGTDPDYTPCIKKDYQWWIDGQLADFLLGSFREKNLPYPQLPAQFEEYKNR